MTGREDNFTSTVDAAASAERFRALSTGDYYEPEPPPDAWEVQP